MGAFGHGPLSGDLKYPADAGNLQNGVDEMRWFEYWLKGVDNGMMKEPPVKYFVMGDTMDKAAPGNGKALAFRRGVPLLKIFFFFNLVSCIYKYDCYVLLFLRIAFNRKDTK